MFQKLTDFGYKRSALQAIGFYLAYVILIVAAGALAGGISGALGSQTSSFGIGTVVATVVVLILAFQVLKAKNLLDNFSLILLMIIAAILALLSGALGGLIPVAFLTTKGIKTSGSF